MFKQTLKLITPSNLNAFIGFLRQEAYCSTSTEPVKKLKWDLISAVCIERHPVITKPMSDLERKVQECFYQVEFENSYRSDHELRKEKEAKMAKLTKNDERETSVKQSLLQDFDDACQEEYNKFPFASRITEADEKNITDSLKRKLDKTLLLLVEQKRGNFLFWLPPQGIRNEGETMRQTAERVLLDTCGSDLTAKFYGNSPIGYYKYLYPRAVRTESSDGAKVFFFLAKYIKGSLSENLKHQWLDRKELTGTLTSDIKKPMFRFLLPD